MAGPHVPQARALGAHTHTHVQNRIHASLGKEPRPRSQEARVLTSLSSTNMSLWDPGEWPFSDSASLLRPHSCSQGLMRPELTPG